MHRITIPCISKLKFYIFMFLRAGKLLCAARVIEARYLKGTHPNGTLRAFTYTRKTFSGS